MTPVTRREWLQRTAAGAVGFGALAVPGATASAYILAEYVEVPSGKEALICCFIECVLAKWAVTVPEFDVRKVRFAGEAVGEVSLLARPHSSGVVWNYYFTLLYVSDAPPNARLKGNPVEYLASIVEPQVESSHHALNDADKKREQSPRSRE